MIIDASGELGRHRSRGRGTGVGAALLTGKVLVALLSFSLLLGMGYFWHNYTSLANGLHHVAVGGLGQPVPGGLGQVSPGSSYRPQHIDGTAQNLLVIGIDSRQGLTKAEEKEFHVGSDVSDSTDTLMVVHVPSNGAKATLISIPRDSYVEIPGFKSNKINAAYVDGYTDGTDGFPVTSSSTPDQRQAAGLTVLIRVIKSLAGLEIDHYVLVNFLGFYNIAKAINGVSVNLCHTVDDPYSGFKMSAGHHDLNPQQSLAFVRQRHNLPGNEDELGREARQRYFLAAAFKKIESAGTLLNPSKLSNLISAIKSTLTVDPQLSLTRLADQMLDLSEGNIVGQTIHTDGSRTFAYPVGSALIVDPPTVQAQIQKWLNPPPKTQSIKSTGSPRFTPQPESPTPTVSQADPSKGCIN